MRIIEHIKSNRTIYIINAIALLALILLIGAYNAGQTDAKYNHNSDKVSTLDKQYINLERCKAVLEATHDFSPKWCEGIQEDDSRLIRTYETNKLNRSKGIYPYYLPND